MKRLFFVIATVMAFCLTSCAGSAGRNHPDLPHRLRGIEPRDGSLPQPVFDMGRTTLRIHFLGDVARYIGYEPIQMIRNTMFEGQQMITGAVDPATGILEFEYDQYGTENVVFMGQLPEVMWVAPGETADIYIDAATAEQWQHYIESEDPGYLPPQKIVAEGRYADLNMLYNDACTGFYGDLWENSGIESSSTDEEYASALMREYRTLADSLNSRTDLPQMVRELDMAELRIQLMDGLCNSVLHRRMLYQAENNYNVTAWPDFKPLGDEYIAGACTLFDISDASLALTMFRSYADVAAAYDWRRVQEGLSGPLADIHTLGSGVADVKGNRLTAEKLAQAETLANPFYGRMLRSMQEVVQIAVAEAEGLVQKSPDVPVEELFDAIVAPYRGKVVMVDFWNTWCGPCRAGIAAVEPLKSGELKSDDIVWLYIANHTSPSGTYMQMIPGIEGIHYRLDEAAWRYLCDKQFHIDGIPAYVLVRRNGAYGLCNDLHDRDALVRELKRLLAE